MAEPLRPGDEDGPPGLWPDLYAFGKGFGRGWWVVAGGAISTTVAIAADVFGKAAWEIKWWVWIPAIAGWIVGPFIAFRRERASRREYGRELEKEKSRRRVYVECKGHHKIDPVLVEMPKDGGKVGRPITVYEGKEFRGWLMKIPRLFVQNDGERAVHLEFSIVVPFKEEARAQRYCSPIPLFDEREIEKVKASKEGEGTVQRWVEIKPGERATLALSTMFQWHIAGEDPFDVELDAVQLLVTNTVARDEEPLRLFLPLGKGTLPK